MKVIRYGLALAACLLILWGAARVATPVGDAASVRAHLRAASSPPRAPDMLRYLPVLR